MRKEVEPRINTLKYQCKHNQTLEWKIWISKFFTEVEQLDITSLYDYALADYTQETIQLHLVHNDHKEQPVTFILPISEKCESHVWIAVVLRFAY